MAGGVLGSVRRWRCPEVLTNWHSGAAHNWREKHEEARAIEGENKRAWNNFQSHYSRSFFLERYFLGMFWGSFGGLKTYSEKKKIYGSELLNQIVFEGLHFTGCSKLGSFTRPKLGAR